MAYKLPALRFGNDALEPYAQFAGLTIDDLLRRPDPGPETRGRILCHLGRSTTSVR